jgi:phage terminase Nu1 subunit (DNA packaging protein)
MPPKRRLLTPTQLARELGYKGRSIVADWRRNGCPVADVQGNATLYDVDEVKAWLVRTGRKSDPKAPKTADGAKPGSTYTDARRLLTLEQAALATLKRRKYARELVSREEVQAELSALLSTARAVLESMPDRSAAQLCEALGLDLAEYSPRLREALRAVALDTLREIAKAGEAFE